VSRLFHTLVVVGAGLTTASCAGKSEHAPQGKGAGGDGAGSDGAGRGGASGHANAGGDAGDGSDGTLSVGGARNTGDPELGPEAQWDCSAQFGACLANQGAFIGDRACPVDPTRPASAEDCADGELFSCFIAATSETESIMVNCSCAPAPGGPCEACVWPDGRTVSSGTCSGDTRVCPCAVTGILVPK
jgi:hypothetical protein